MLMTIERDALSPRRSRVFGKHLANTAQIVLGRKGAIVSTYSQLCALCARHTPRKNATTIAHIIGRRYVIVMYIRIEPPNAPRIVSTSPAFGSVSIRSPFGLYSVSIRFLFGFCSLPIWIAFAIHSLSIRIRVSFHAARCYLAALYALSSVLRTFFLVELTRAVAWLGCPAGRSPCACLAPRRGNNTAYTTAYTTPCSHLNATSVRPGQRRVIGPGRLLSLHFLRSSLHVLTSALLEHNPMHTATSLPL